MWWLGIFSIQIHEYENFNKLKGKIETRKPQDQYATDPNPNESLYILVFICISKES